MSLRLERRAAWNPEYMSSVHRITLQALEPSAEQACDHIARFMPDAVFGPAERLDEVVELLIPAADVSAALERTWDALSAGADAELSAVVGISRH